MTITYNEYKGFQDAYNYFNEHLFDNTLPHVMITLQHGKKYRGYCSYDRFIERNNKEVKVCELAMNPDCFEDRTDKEILSTLVHEQCHVWQYAFGKLSRNGYHNKEWGTKMKAIGLFPSSTGQQGGKETGQSVSHYIIPNGVFEQHCTNLIDSGFKLNWQSFSNTGKVAGKKKQTRAKFTCPDCDLAAWAKPDAKIVCSDCEILMKGDQ